MSPDEPFNLIGELIASQARLIARCNLAPGNARLAAKLRRVSDLLSSLQEKASAKKDG
jgi:hypothetical protein